MVHVDDSFGWLGLQQVFYSVALAKKSTPPEFPQTSDHFPEEQSLHLVVTGSPPYQEFPTKKDSPTVHSLRKNRTEPIIESDQEAEASPSHVGKTGLKAGSEEPITKAPQRLPDSLFPKETQSQTLSKTRYSI